MKLQGRQIVGILAVIVGVVLLVALVFSIGGSSDGGGGVTGPTIAEKNTRRQTDLQTLLAKIEDYRDRNGGSLPNGVAGWQKFADEYLPDFRDPDGTDYKLVQTCDYNTQFCVMPDALGWDQNKYQIYVAWHAKCANGALAGYQKGDPIVAYMALQDARPVCVDK